MEDSRIIELYFERNESAIAETASKYERYCHRVSLNILCDEEDARECVNDTFLAAWNAIPPHRPEMLSTFLAKITRRLSLKKLRERTAQKRGGSGIDVPLEELEDCIPAGSTVDGELEAKELTDIINSFLETLPVTERRIFLRRYWYFDSVDDICRRFGFGKSKVKMTLKRTRDKLRAHLERESYL